LSGGDLLKKIGICIGVCLAALFLVFSAVFAEENIIETPDVKIVIDGKITQYDSVPLSVNQRTLLPYREILEYIGIPNDDEHVVWNEEDKSVTIKNGSTVIYFRIGDKMAYVNDFAVTLDVAPMIYTNGKVYIPVRFVSEALNKKVIWDGSTKAVLIRDEDKYNEVRDVLDKLNKASEQVVSYKMDMNLDMSMDVDDLQLNIGAGVKSQVDLKRKRMYMQVGLKMLSLETAVDYYYLDGCVYYNNPFTNEWFKKVMSTQEYYELFDSNVSCKIMNAEEVLCAGLVIKESEDSESLVLEGQVFLDEIYDSALGTSSSIGAINNTGITEKNDYFVRMQLDKETYLLESFHMSVKGKTVAGNGEVTNTTGDLKITYTDYNEKIELGLPANVINDATVVISSLKAMPRM